MPSGLLDCQKPDTIRPELMSLRKYITQLKPIMSCQSLIYIFFN